ncbi:GNAT family N-acetyltransferase [Streptomyces sp. NPDC127068]|uniref:GNAT family N-acetyltransferase n=1 Tax=Streptomyces sp. NPDC127068 TaxID=3347127 RepID=UPI00365DEE18
MEFGARGLLEIRITPADVGKRVSVRRVHRSPGDTAVFTDTVGVLTSWDEGEGVLVVTRRTGEAVRIDAATLVAGKVVPAAPARRRGPAADYPELARVTARAWQPVEHERLGDWELRAAAGFTRRANSVLPLGDPGVPLDEALALVRKWYEERELPAYLQTATGARGTQEELCAELEARGWTREVSAEVRIAPLTPLATPERTAEPAAVVRVERDFDADWLRRYQRSREPGPEVRQVLAAGAPGTTVWFASVDGEPGAPPLAIGRCVVDGRWAGFMAVEVAPGARRGGLGTAVMAALAGRALAQGASAAWLQVEADNAPALAMYGRAGFTTHHAYHHYRAPGRG